jgi:hypothetical protein
MIYQVGVTLPVPICILLLKNNGVPDTGHSVTLNIFDCDNAIQIVTATIMSDLGNGYYKYTWNHTINSRRTILITMVRNGVIINSYYIRFVTDLNEIKASVSQAVIDINRSTDNSDGRIA